MQVIPRLELERFFHMKPPFSCLKYLDYIYILKPILTTLLRDQNKISPSVEFVFQVKVEKIVLETLDTSSSG